MPHLVDTLSRLKSHGIDFNFALDIGAHHGEWFKRFKTVYSSTDVLSIEANKENIPFLSQVNPNCRELCLGSLEEVRSFFLPNPLLCKDNTGASLYKEGLKFYEGAREVAVNVVTLDGLGLSPDFIKLDVQGAELDVLTGGLKTFTQCKALQIEISVCEYNISSPTPSRLIAFLYQNGFELETVFDVVSFNGRVSHLDALFVGPELSFLRRDLSFINKLIEGG